MNIEYKNGERELTEHADAKAATAHLFRRMAELGGEVKNANLMVEGDETEHAGRRYRLTAAGFKRVGGNGGLYDLVPERPRDVGAGGTMTATPPVYLADDLLRPPAGDRPSRPQRRSSRRARSCAVLVLFGVLHFPGGAG